MVELTEQHLRDAHREGYKLGFAHGATKQRSLAHLPGKLRFPVPKYHRTHWDTSKIRKKFKELFS